MNVTAYTQAERWIGLAELPGDPSQPFILGMLRLHHSWPESDEVAWCSAFLEFIAFGLGLPSPKSLRARAWLEVGQAVQLRDARIGFDVVILKRGGQNEPGPEVVEAKGHVGLYAGRVGGRVYLLAGNQSNKVCVQGFPEERVLGVRRLLDEAGAP